MIYNGLVVDDMHVCDVMIYSLWLMICNGVAVDDMHVCDVMIYSLWLVICNGLAVDDMHVCDVVIYSLWLMICTRDASDTVGGEEKRGQENLFARVQRAVGVTLTLSLVNTL